MSTRIPLWAVVLLAVLGLVGPVESQAPPETKSKSQLKEVPIDLDLSDAKSPVDSIVFFEAPDPYGTERIEIVTGLLRRELYRQGLLLAARDELGLTTRDGSLGDVPPDDLPPLNRFRINPYLVASRRHEVKIEVGPAAASRVIWKAEGTNPAGDEEERVHAAETAESGTLWGSGDA